MHYASLLAVLVQIGRAVGGEERGGGGLVGQVADLEAGRAGHGAALRVERERKVPVAARLLLVFGAVVVARVDLDGLCGVGGECDRHLEDAAVLLGWLRDFNVLERERLVEIGARVESL